MTRTSHTVHVEDLLPHREWVHVLARALVRSGQDPDDVEQETWLEALQSAPGTGSPRAWLTTVLQRTAGHLRRRDRMRKEREGAAPRNAEVRPTAEVVAQAELQVRLVRTVLALPEPYRDTVLLRFYEGLTLPEIARRVDAPLETIRSRLRRGLAILRSELERSDGAGWRLAFAPLACAKGGALAAGGAFLLSKTTIAVVAVALFALSWLGWTVLQGARVPTPAPVGSTKPGAAEDASPADAGRAPVTPLRPRPFSDADAAGSSRSPPTGPITAGTAAVFGHVLAPDGSPVEGASVIAGDPETQGGLLIDEDAMRLNLKLVFSLDPILYPSEYCPKTRTDSTGAFRFDQVRAASRLTVAAYHSELGLTATFGIPVREGKDRQITLRYEPGVRFFGTVTDQDQRPIHLAKVRLTGYREDGRAQSLPFVQSDASGSYRTEPVSGNQFHVRATVEGCYTAVARVKDLPLGTREHRVDLTFERAPRLRGRLLAHDGSPARVTEHLKDLFGKDGPDAAQGLVLLASTDDPRSDPNFRSIQGAEGRLLEKDDAYELVPESRALKFLSVWLGGDLLGFAELVAPDVAPDILVDWSRASRPRPRGSLQIVVKSAEDDSPVADYDVRVTGPLEGRPIEQSEWGQVVSAVDGRFTFERILVGRYEVKVTARGFDPGKTVAEARAAPEAGQAVVALVPRSRSAATASIAGEVRGPRGEPVNGAKVWIVPERADRSPEARRAVTDADGVFRVDRLLPEGYFVIAEPPRGARLAPAWARVTAQAAERASITLVEGVDVQIVPEGTPGPLSFRIVDESGVALLDDSRDRGQRWGALHRFRLPTGRYEVHASCPGFIPARGQLLATEGASLTLVFTREPK